jgi:hypothetical protein
MSENDDLSRRIMKALDKCRKAREAGDLDLSLRYLMKAGRLFRRWEGPGHP